mmetsp:Transcript_99622/g.191251  ORF Transcript_99622/g.191251 Transcript_99622/m.191251 type:complete len:273 (+) Transcript_99622:387-1205(+)
MPSNILVLVFIEVHVDTIGPLAPIKSTSLPQDTSLDILQPNWTWLRLYTNITINITTATALCNAPGCASCYQAWLASQHCPLGVHLDFEELLSQQLRGPCAPSEEEKRSAQIVVDNSLPSISPIAQQFEGLLLESWLRLFRRLRMALLLQSWWWASSPNCLGTTGSLSQFQPRVGSSGICTETIQHLLGGCLQLLHPSAAEYGFQRDPATLGFSHDALEECIVTQIAIREIKKDLCTNRITTLFITSRAIAAGGIATIKLVVRMHYWWWWQS